jgi:hypothetical protein
MAILNLFLGRTQAESDALAALRAHEDAIFDLQPGEDRDLAAHVRAEAPRFRLLRDRMTFGSAQSARKADRNWYTLLTLGTIMVAKGIITPAAIVSFIWAVFKAIMNIG